MSFEKTGALITRLAQTIKALRTPETGCPWDLEQDHKSLRPYLLEEAYEVLQAIDTEDDALFCDELGDLLLQVVLHAQIASDREAFHLDQVIEAIDSKMIRRHPHVFGDLKVESAAEVLSNWEAFKLTEKKNGSEKPAAPELPISAKLSDVPPALPALIRAQRIGEKAARYNFDWDSVENVFGKVKEELGELEREITALPQLSARKNDPSRARQVLDDAQRTRLEEELGDSLFALCQLSRWLGLHAEDALRSTSERFLARFAAMERELGPKLADLSEAELDAAWRRAKKALKPE